MSKELLFSALKHEKLTECPWVPFAGVHAGLLCGYDATEVLTDGDKLLKSLLEVNRLYAPDGMPVVFDLQLEAEILGCELKWTHDGPPSVVSHPLDDDRVVPCKCMIPEATDGRLPMVLDVMKRLKAAVGDTTALYGLICGPFTLASHLRGNEIFMDMFDDEEYVNDLLSFCADVAIAMSDMYTSAGMDVIAVVDPLVSQVSAAHFEQFLDAPFKRIFDNIRAKGVYSSFFVCGNATRSIEAMCKTGPDSISVDENVNMHNAKEICNKYNITIGGNIPLTTTMLHGTQQDNMKFVVDMLDSFADKTNLIIAPGCDLPYATPIENCVAAAQAAHHLGAAREIIANYVAVDEDIAVELPDYAHLSKPLVEVFTLDSATCAACTYMMGAARTIKDIFDDAIDLVEYKYTIKENIARCKKMKVAQLPSIYINGELKYSSIIPERTAFEAAVRAKL